MEVRTVEASVHGRVLYERRSDARLIVGFHGYAENAEKHIVELHKIPGIDTWSVAAIQALHPFYGSRSQGGDVVASWMTRLDRETAIADNIEYVRRALREIGAGEDSRAPKTLVFAGFSQGVAMAYRAAAFSAPANGVIALAGDVPPDVSDADVRLSRVLVGRGDKDDWYTQERMDRDLAYLSDMAEVTVCRFEGGHEWTDEFRAAAGLFLKHLVL